MPVMMPCGVVLLDEAQTPPLTGLTNYFYFPFPHGFAVGYMTAPATRACGRPRGYLLFL